MNNYLVIDGKQYRENDEVLSFTATFSDGRDGKRVGEKQRFVQNTEFQDANGSVIPAAIWEHPNISIDKRGCTYTFTSMGRGGIRVEYNKWLKGLQLNICQSTEIICAASPTAVTMNIPEQTQLQPAEQRTSMVATTSEFSLPEISTVLDKCTHDAVIICKRHSMDLSHVQDVSSTLFIEFGKRFRKERY